MLPRVEAPQAAAMVAAQSSLVFDYVSRQKVGGIHMNLFVWKQLPVPTPAMLEPHLSFIVPRVLELVYTAYDMTPLARDLGDEGAPFRWDEERRALLRAELDAFFFRMYGIDDPVDVDYILDTFATETGGLKHNEIAKYGEYRTKRLVLDAHARMSTPTRRASVSPLRSPRPPVAAPATPIASEGADSSMTYKSEDQLKKALEVDSWRNLSRDKMIRFAAMMPDMDRELALKIVDQFPEFKRFALDALDVIEKGHESALAHNQRSQEIFYQGNREIRAILERQLEKDNLTWEQKKFIIEQIMETGKREFEKDSENKRFLDGVFGKLAAAGAGAVVLGVAVLGGKALAQRGGDSG